MKYEFFDSPVHGTGSRATVDIKKGDLVSEEPYFVIRRFAGESIKYAFRRYTWTGRMINEPECKLLVNGLGAWCNASDDPNIKSCMNSDNSKMNFYALKDIKKGEEFFLYYLFS